MSKVYPYKTLSEGAKIVFLDAVWKSRKNSTLLGRFQTPCIENPKIIFMVRYGFDSRCIQESGLLYLRNTMPTKILFLTYFIKQQRKNILTVSYYFSTDNVKDLTLIRTLSRIVSDHCLLRRVFFSWCTSSVRCK